MNTRRGRRLGLDVYQQVVAQVPLTLVGIGSERCSGAGEVSHHELPLRMAGTPVVGLATTELVTLIRNGGNGIIDTRVDALVHAMRDLIADPSEARRLGEAGRRSAQERFHIDRFVSDWMRVFHEATS